MNENRPAWKRYLLRYIDPGRELLDQVQHALIDGADRAVCEGRRAIDGLQRLGNVQPMVEALNQQLTELAQRFFPGLR